MENAGNPHYLPTAAVSRRIGADELVLLDLWGKLPEPGAVYADITWVGFTGRRVPDELARAFARRRATRATRPSRWCADGGARRARRCAGGRSTARRGRCSSEAGYGAHVLHRTGHSLGEEVHGNGVHMDDYETHDDRRLLPGTGFTIEPGLYFEPFGVRTEINMFYGAGEADVTGPGADRNRRAGVADSRALRPAASFGGSRMSTRKTTAVLRRAHRGRLGWPSAWCIASRLDLSPESSAQTMAVPATNSAPLDRPGRRRDLPEHRQGADARRS